jgi:SAM-dependent methyltransferase
LTELETWYRSDSGRYLLQQLETRLAGELDTAFGYHLAQVGVTRCHPLFDTSPVRHRVYVADRAGDFVGLVAAADQLPLATDSVDVVIAHHALEFSQAPHQALREMHRVLTPQGHLFVIGFNPWSLAGAGLALRGRAGRAPWRDRRGLSNWRLSDWLNLLGLEEESVTQCFALPPFGGRRLRGAIDAFNQWIARHHLPVGGVYIVHAIKQVPGNIRLAQRVRRPRLIDIAVPKPVSAPRPTPTPRRGDNAA